MKLYNSSSLAEKQRMVEKNEQEMMQRNQQKAQAEQEAMQAQMQAQMQDKQAERELKDTMNIRDNETKLLIAQMGQYANEETSEDVDYSPEAKEELAEKIRQFNEKMTLERDKFNYDKVKHQDDVKLKIKQINKPKTVTSK